MLSLLSHPHIALPNGCWEVRAMLCYLYFTLNAFVLTSKALCGASV